MSIFSSLTPRQKDRLLLSVVTILTLLHFLGRLLWRYPTGTPFDTASYYQSAAIVMNGSLDIFRTPGYPLLLSMAVKLLGFNNYAFICALQAALLVLSVPALWYVCRRCGLNLFWRTAVTMLYGPLSTLHVINAFYILTDGITLYLIVIWAAAVFALARRVRVLPAIGVILLPLLCISIRPFALYILIVSAITAIFWLRRRSLRKAAWILAASIILSGTCTLLYSWQIKQKAGVFSTSSVAKYNDFLYISLYYPMDYFEGMPILQRITPLWAGGDYTIELAQEFWYAPREYFPEINREIDLFAREHPDFRLHTRYYFCKREMTQAGPFFFIGGWVYPLLALLATGCLLWLWFSPGITRWMLSWNWLMYMGPFGLVVINAPVDWARLTMPGMPFVYILLCLALQRLCASKSKE